MAVCKKSRVFQSTGKETASSYINISRECRTRVKGTERADLSCLHLSPLSLTCRCVTKSKPAQASRLPPAPSSTGRGFRERSLSHISAVLRHLSSRASFPGQEEKWEPCWSLRGQTELTRWQYLGRLVYFSSLPFAGNELLR